MLKERRNPYQPLGQNPLQLRAQPIGCDPDVPYGNLAEPHTWSVIERIIEEAWVVCSSEGIDLPGPQPAII